MGLILNPYSFALPTGPISQSKGSSIGDLTTGGGLAALFDGTTNKAAASCAQATGEPKYGGKNYSVDGAERISQVLVHGSNDEGYLSGSNANVTFELCAMHTAPSAADDAGRTVLGTLGPSADTGNESAGRPISSSDTATAWEYVWVRFNSAAGTDFWRIAQLIFHRP